MRYLIDGYNLFFKIEQNILPLDIKREEFLKNLDLEIAELKLKSILVFDSHSEHAHSFPTSKKMQKLEIVFSPKNQSADDYIIELLSWDNKETILVTSDNELARKAKQMGTNTYSVEKFIAFILKKRKKQLDIHEKNVCYQSDAYLQRLLKIFEKQLSEDEDI